MDIKRWSMIFKISGKNKLADFHGKLIQGNHGKYLLNYTKDGNYEVLEKGKDDTYKVLNAYLSYQRIIEGMKEYDWKITEA